MYYSTTQYVLQHYTVCTTALHSMYYSTTQYVLCGRYMENAVQMQSHAQCRDPCARRRCSEEEEVSGAVIGRPSKILTRLWPDRPSFALRIYWIHGRPHAIQRRDLFRLPTCPNRSYISADYVAFRSAVCHPHPSPSPSSSPTTTSTPTPKPTPEKKGFANSPRPSARHRQPVI